MYRSSSVHRLLALWIAAAAIACDSASGSGGGGTVVPAAEAYDRASAFEGEWLGESDGVRGTLKIERLGALRYYARFAGHDEATRYVANLQQVQVPAGEEEGVPGNLARFTWLDGRGGGGSGWLMINREDSAITGMLTHGASQRPGEMSFVRVEE